MPGNQPIIRHEGVKLKKNEIKNNYRKQNNKEKQQTNKQKEKPLKADPKSGWRLFQTAELKQ